MLAKIEVITLQQPDQDGKISINIRIHPNEDIGECYKFIFDLLERNGILVI
jgi:hypothetical protein